MSILVCIERALVQVLVFLWGVGNVSCVARVVREECRRWGKSKGDRQASCQYSTVLYCKSILRSSHSALLDVKSGLRRLAGALEALEHDACAVLELCCTHNPGHSLFQCEGREPYKFWIRLKFSFLLLCCAWLLCYRYSTGTLYGGPLNLCYAMLECTSRLWCQGTPRASGKEGKGTFANRRGERKKGKPQITRWPLPRI